MAGLLGGLFLGRVVPATFFGLFFVAKLSELSSAGRSLAAGVSAMATLRLLTQVLSLSYFGLLAFLYVVRLPRRSGRRDPLTAAVALFSSFAVMTIGLLPDRQTRPELEGLAAALVAGGAAYAIWALAHLRRSFSILPEARRLVTTGPYRLSRHPLYLGEGLACLGLLIPVAGPSAIALAMVNLGTQLLRIRWEEKVLAAEFPGYAHYARKVPRYVPFLV